MPFIKSMLNAGVSLAVLTAAKNSKSEPYSEQARQVTAQDYQKVIGHFVGQRVDGQERGFLYPTGSQYYPCDESVV